MIFITQMPSHVQVRVASNTTSVLHGEVTETMFTSIDGGRNLALEEPLFDTHAGAVCEGVYEDDGTFICKFSDWLNVSKRRKIK
jgi:hypothetical protein